jgi:hypothetical protein
MAWLVTENRGTVEKVLYLHNRIFAEYPLKTYLMGFSYSTLEGDEEEEDDSTDIQLEKKLLKMKFEEEKQKRKLKVEEDQKK